MTSRLPETSLPIVNPQGTDKEMLDTLLAETFLFFRDEVNPQTGLTPDKTQPHSPASIAAVGLSLCAHIVAVGTRFMFEGDAVDEHSQGPEVSPFASSGTGNGRFGLQRFFLSLPRYAHRPACLELRVVDHRYRYPDGRHSYSSRLLLSRQRATKAKSANSLTPYTGESTGNGLSTGKATICHGWKPESGFLSYRWDTGYSEAHILYVLALGSPSFPIDPRGYRQWTSTFKNQVIYGYDHLYAGPLFIHQMSHQWLDFRGIHDDFNRKTGIDYFENSRRATYVQRQYAIENPLQFAHYGENGWGLTASDGPGPATLELNGVQRVFYDYIARGAPFGPDDGTLSPWAVIASLPFAPEIVIPTARHAIERLDLKKHSRYGFDASFNPTFPETSKNPNGWVSPWIFGLNQGPIILMIENFQSGLIWNLIRKCPHIARGLARAGFEPAK